MKLSHPPEGASLLSEGLPKRRPSFAVKGDPQALVRAAGRAADDRRCNEVAQTSTLLPPGKPLLPGVAFLRFDRNRRVRHGLLGSKFKKTRTIEFGKLYRPVEMGLKRMPQCSQHPVLWSRVNGTPHAGHRQTRLPKMTKATKAFMPRHRVKAVWLRSDQEDGNTKTKNTPAAKQDKAVRK